MKLQENKHYQLIPADVDGKELWHVHIIDEDSLYFGTTIKFGTLQPDPQNQEIRFSFEVVETPSLDLNEEDEGLQNYATMLLSSIIPDTLES